MGVASLVIGIIALVVGLFINMPVGIIAGVIAIVLGALGRKNGQGGVATAGMVLGIIAVALCAVTYIACLICANSVASLF